ncbi:hypothetical protein HYR54_00385 [Candidatus Acetothermia bacterium]|nr:hypothetical protein [Candidatus Acetothermia bacterium]
MNLILESLQPVIAQSDHVRIDGHALEKFCQWVVVEKRRAPAWDVRYHFDDGTERTVTYLLVLDSLNFCFWGHPHWEIVYEHEKLSGYLALTATLKRAITEKVPVLDASYLAKISDKELSRTLHGEGRLHLWEKRLEILRETGTVLLEKYHGQAHCLVEAAQRSATRLVELLVADFPSFRDEASYKGHRVLFHKRAQIFVADLHVAFQGKSWGEFFDIDQLTAFADYKLPQVLRHLGILKYSTSLAERVDRQELIAPGSLEEVEIRAHTLWAVELIRRGLAALNYSLRAYEIDWLLWNLGQEDTYRAKPYHRTVTIYY